MGVCFNSIFSRQKREYVEKFALFGDYIFASFNISPLEGSTYRKYTHGSVLRNVTQPGRMVSIFHISNTNGGIGDPVVDLKHNSGERERGKHARGMRGFVCLMSAPMLIIGLILWA